MNREIKLMLAIIGAVTSGSSLPQVEENIDWDKIYSVSSAHSVANIVAYGIIGGGYAVPENTKAAFMNRLYERVAVDENQKACLEELFSAFSDNDIAYMPVKGAVLKMLYPSSDMRSMSDADILIKCGEFEKITRIMTDLGYEFKLESDHEYVYQKRPYMNIELHKSLVPTYNDDLYGYYGDGWTVAKKRENDSRYDLSAEDGLVYIMTHLAKHYRDAGAGIKSVLDIWLYRRAYTNMDAEYIDAQLRRLNIKAFADNVIRLTGVWFENCAADEVTEHMTAFIINSGEFGNIYNSAAAKTIREYSDNSVNEIEKQRYLRLVFPNLRHMQSSYPTLKRAPYLLPAFWVYRLARVPFCRDSRAVMQQAKLLTSRDVRGHYLHMNEVGLDIYNGRKSK